MKYSKLTGGFYDETIHATTQIPADAVEITRAEHEALLIGQAQGKLISTGTLGKPVLTDPPPKPLTEVKATKLAQLEQARDAAERANVTVGGNVYPASEAFHAKVSRAINQSGRGKPIAGAADAWRTADMKPVVMTAALLELIEDAITAQGAAAWTRFGQRFDAVQAATTNAAVEGVVW